MLPNVVIELTSKKTRQADQTTKPELYARLGVQEYFLFDPYGEYLRPQLQGHQRVDGHYERMQGFPLRSTMLNLELRQVENTLRLFNPVTGKKLLTADEMAEARLGEEASRRIAEQRAEKAAHDAGEAARSAIKAAASAAEAAARASAAEVRTAAAEAEVARLRALLEQAGRGE